MAFDPGKIHKLQDRLESEAYDWMDYRVCEYYEVEDTSELTKEQVEELEEYADSDDCYESYVGMALRTICDQWRDENEDYE